MLNLGTWKCIKTFAPREEEYGVDCYESSYYHITKDGDDYRTDGSDSGSSVLFSLSELNEHFMS